MSDLFNKATQWVIANNPRHTRHLVQSEYWLRQFAPDVPLSVRIATLTHDMERAFPGDDSPDMSRMVRPTDTLYNIAHGRRSARFVSAWLKEQGADEAFVDIVSDLIVVHEYGGWPEADLVQAADSVSFLEVNTQLFIDWIATAKHGWGYERTMTKFNWMYDRITIPAAKKLAKPFFVDAIAQIEAAKPK